MSPPGGVTRSIDMCRHLGTELFNTENITWITQVDTINGRPGLRMAVRRRPKSVGAGLAYGLLAVHPLCL